MKSKERKINKFWNTTPFNLSILTWLVKNDLNYFESSR